MITGWQINPLHSAFLDHGWLSLHIWRAVSKALGKEIHRDESKTPHQFVTEDEKCYFFPEGRPTGRLNWDWLTISGMMASDPGMMDIKRFGGHILLIVNR